jgi:hypothetical protein
VAKTAVEKVFFIEEIRKDFNLKPLHYLEESLYPSFRPFPSHQICTSLPVCSLSSVILTGRIHILSPVEITVSERCNKALCGSDVGRYGTVLHVALLEKVVLRLVDNSVGVGVSEVNYKVNLVVGRLGCYLIYAAGFACKEGLYFKAGCVGNVFAGYMSSTEVVLAENTAISDTKLSHKFFFVVSSNNCDLHGYPPLLLIYVVDWLIFSERSVKSTNYAFYIIISPSRPFVNYRDIISAHFTIYFIYSTTRASTLVICRNAPTAVKSGFCGRILLHFQLSEPYFSALIQKIKQNYDKIKFSS